MKDDVGSLMMMMSSKRCRWYDVYAVTMKTCWWDDDMVMSHCIDALCRRWYWSGETKSPDDETFCGTVYHYHEALYKVSRRTDQRM